MIPLLSMDEGRHSPGRVLAQLAGILRKYSDGLRVLAIKTSDRWPCTRKRYLIVGAESSGTTAIANLVFMEIRGIRFLDEGENHWVWDAYKNVYRGTKRIHDYPRLQLFDAIKVPGFATIIDKFREGFPNSRVIYVVRDPRDFINSAIKTWRVDSVAALSNIPWCTEDWLDIPHEDPVERLSMRWKTYVKLAMGSNDVTFVRYEDFCADKINTIAHLSALLGLPFNRQRVQNLCDDQLCHRSVRDYRPTGPGAWKNGMLGRDDIAKIEQICREEMLYWNYELSTL